MPTIRLFPFAFFDLVRRRWYPARYVATLEDITDRCAAFRITGEPEMREVGDARTLTAGHLARSPRIRENAPIASAGDSVRERSGHERE